MSLSEYEKLKKEFEQKVKKLQDNCPHKRLSGWHEGMWAPGHFTGTSTRICLRCYKRVMNDYTTKICQDCGEKNSWCLNTCLKCQRQNLKHYSIIEKNGKIIKQKEI